MEIPDQTGYKAGCLVVLQFARLSESLHAMESSGLAPQLTVGLIVGELRERAERSLRHILAQTALERMEVIVVDVSRGGSFAGSDHPKVRYLHRPQFRFYCEAQIEAVRQARSQVIAFLEDHTYAEPQWAEAILETMGNPRVAAVNYTFTNASDAGYLGRSILMAEYGHWMAPHPGGRVRISSSTNVAYRRELLLATMGDDESIFEAEFLIHREIQKSGGEIHVASRATVAHESWGTLKAACQANGAYKRVLGARRAESGNWGKGRRLIWGLGMVLMPGLSIARLAAAMYRRPALWGRLISSVPVLMAIYTYCAWSEALGYLRGAGASREEFLARELAVQRHG
jgi:hypothetical protein